MNHRKFQPDRIIDARGCILGRVSSQVARLSLEGNKIAIINAEYVVITGSEQDILSRFQKRMEIGSDQGPYYPKRPDRIVKRAIRGMLPYKLKRGRAALESIRVYVGNPFETEGEVLANTSLEDPSQIRYVELGLISEKLGAKITW
jgi:large subunit ribosomal protein L13